jgi:hypothetical protein
MTKHTPESLTLDSLVYNMEEAKGFLETARDRCTELNLPGTVSELRAAISYVNSILFEIDHKEQIEFAPFRSPNGSRETT